jgi:hypothetical protein
MSAEDDIKAQIGIVAACVAKVETKEARVDELTAKVLEAKAEDKQDIRDAIAGTKEQLADAKKQRDEEKAVLKRMRAPRSILADGLPQLVKSSASPTDAHKTQSHLPASMEEKPFCEQMLRVDFARGTAVYGVLGKLNVFSYRSEADVAGFCVLVINEILQMLRLDENRKVIVMNECTILNWRGDIWLVLGSNQMPLLVIEVKKPKGDAELKNKELGGQLFDYLSEIKSFTGLKHVFGAASSYDRWRFVWLPSDETDTLAAETKLRASVVDTDSYNIEVPDATATWGEEEASRSTWSRFTDLFKSKASTTDTKSSHDQGDEKLVPPSADAPRLLHCSRLFQYNDAALVPSLLNLMSKALSSPVHSVPLISASRAYLAIDRDSVTWGRFPSGVTEINYAKMPHKNCAKFVLVCHLGGGSSGRVWLAISASGSACVIKRPRQDVLSADDFKQFSASLHYECGVWNKFFSEKARTTLLGGVPALVMPFARPLTIDEWDDEEVCAAVANTIRTLAPKGFAHGDLKREHVGVYLEKGKTKYCFFDSMKPDQTVEADDMLDALGLSGQ